MGPYGSEHFKTLLLLQFRFFLNQTFSTYSLWQSSKNLRIGILKLQIWNLKKKNEIFPNMGPYGRENFKTLLVLQFSIFFDQTFFNVPCNNLHKTCFLKFQIPNFLKKIEI